MDSTGADQAVALHVRAAMTAANLTENKLAEYTGIPRQTLHRRLEAQTSFSINQLAKIASVLGVHPREFFTGVGTAA